MPNADQMIRAVETYCRAETEKDKAAQRSTLIFQFGKHSRFDRYEDDFARAENVNLVLHATAVHLADKGGRAIRLDCATLSGNRFTVQARTFILAAGAIETARLLLVSTDSQPAGIGNSRDLVGRSFMEHPDAAVGYGAYGAPPAVVAFQLLGNLVPVLVGVALIFGFKFKDNGVLIVWSINR